MDTILRIDVAADGGPQARPQPSTDYAGLGGRALTSAIVSGEVPPTCHPLGGHNKLVIAPGVLCGTAAAVAGRISVGCKSPLTGGIKEANAGGMPGQTLARLGYAALVIEGERRDGSLWLLHLSQDGVAVEPADDLRLLGNYETVERLQQRYGDDIAVMSIGPAGEMRLAAASVACSDIEHRPTRHAGRGGVGAVMGSKGIKAIVIDSSGTERRAAKDSERFRAANKVWVEGLKRHAVTGQALPAYGTNVLTNILNEAGGYPTRNFYAGRFDHAAKISGEAEAAVEEERGGLATHGCSAGCVIRCSGIYTDKDGHYITKQPEYETVWAHGGNCGIGDLDTIARLDRLDDDIGLDTIEMGATIGVAMDGGLLEFGDGAGAIRLIEEVGKGTPLGRVLGSGAAVTGKVLGVRRVPVVKGQAMPAYDPRAVQGIGVTYATSPMGADHTAGYAVTANILNVGGSVDPLSPQGQTELSRNLQIATAAVDSTGMCLFIAFAILDQPDTFQALLDLLGAMDGTTVTGDDVTALGKRVLEMELAFNRGAGFTDADDRLPDFFTEEKLSPHDVTFMVPPEELATTLRW
jgi:aldehyde:ferredoxin oxidoreductase